MVLGRLWLGHQSDSLVMPFRAHGVQWSVAGCGILLAYGWKLKCKVKCHEFPPTSCGCRQAHNARKAFWAWLEPKSARQSFFKATDFAFTWLRYSWELQSVISGEACLLLPYPKLQQSCCRNTCSAARAQGTHSRLIAGVVPAPWCFALGTK